MFKYDSPSGNGNFALIWLNDISELDELSIEQINNALEHPKLISPLIIMADCHVGYGIPIGSVMKLSDAISPYAIGYDINCGMLSCKLNIKSNSLTTSDLENIIHETRSVVAYKAGEYLEHPITDSPLQKKGSMFRDWLENNPVIFVL